MIRQKWRQNSCKGKQIFLFLSVRLLQNMEVVCLLFTKLREYVWDGQPLSSSHVPFVKALGVQGAPLQGYAYHYTAAEMRSKERPWGLPARGHVAGLLAHGEPRKQT